ncbi:hypothetical protein [Streptomyces sp. ASQP_92]|uniref:hypothetical protein n=1 Tax=Streptomyces sp. ASQP_92 TaxID=2979116 RepID=UPI0021BFDC8A|nr:hypothetical protein [Streptomyces sp. ASQP_92]
MTRSTIRTEEQRWRRGDSWVILGAIILGIALAAIVVSIYQLQSSLQTSNDARDMLARQVQELGHTPVAGPPGSRGEPGQSLTGPRGPEGEPGPVGPTGPVGPAGKTGQTGTPGTSATGAPGTAGQPGSVGPQGSPGPTGPAGAPGKDGTDGAAGKDGTDGKPPAGWTYTDPQGVEYQCVPADGFDPNAPRYKCTAVNQPPPSPAARRSLFGVGALAMSSMYRRLNA